MRARASASIQQGRVHLAAIYFAQSGLSFDEVALTLLHCLDFAGSTVSNSNNNNSNSSNNNNGNNSSGAALEGSAVPTNPLLESNVSYFSTSNEPATQLYSKVCSFFCFFSFDLFVA